MDSEPKRSDYGDIETILALATVPGRSGVAILRLSGPRSLVLARRICRLSSEPRQATYTAFTDPKTGEVLDRGLVLTFPGPASFTGEDVVECHVHGSMAVVRALTRVILEADTGIRLARPGEFSKRAFLNGKMDLVAAEGLADLIDSETEWQRKQALRQMEGELARLCAAWRGSLVEAMALIEAELDFADEGDIPTELKGAVKTLLHPVRDQMEQVIRSADSGERIRSGFRVVISGPPNVGKSSLLNAIAGRDAAIVSPVAGTTRDVIEIQLEIRGYPVLLADTAGIRESDDLVEQVGVDRARREIDLADLVLELRDSDDAGFSRSVLPDVRARFVVATKADITPPQFPHDVAISVHENVGIDTLLGRIGHYIENFAQGESALVSNERQRQALARAIEAFGRILGEADLAAELIAEELRYAVRQLDLLIGRVDTEDVFDLIFSRFCIGK